MLRISLFICLICSLVPGYSQSGINYQSKSMLRELKKAFAFEPILTEMLIPVEGASGKYFSLQGPGQAQGSSFIYVGRVNSCRQGGCSVENNTIDGGFEYFDYYVTFDSMGVVLHVRVFNYQSTHGYGITSKRWLQQFSGYQGTDSLVVGRNIDGMSGATVSAHAITSDLQKRVRRLKNWLNNDKQIVICSQK